MLRKDLYMIELERVLGQRKTSRGYRRFLLRGLPKASLEIGWLSLALACSRKLR